MELYQLDKLMEETRQLAAKYRDATGQPLPVSHDLACYDAIRLLKLRAPVEPESGVDAVGTDEFDGQRFQIKGRVHFQNLKGKQQRIGQLNLDGIWDVCLVVILNEAYQAETIYAAEKSVLTDSLADKKVNKRGAMTVAQFKAVSNLIWSLDSEESKKIIQEV